MTRREPPLWKKGALALFSLAATAAVLEGAARLFVAARGPVLVREGYYANPLPLISGPISSSDLPSGERLPARKRPGELRVAVLGESSVWGAPFDENAAMPAMLRDELQARLPGRAVTVVNMGRPGSVSANAYYYLLFLRRYSPDFVVFYMGMNDSQSMGGEQCLLARRPRVHAAWRTLAERSWLLWTVRAFGPSLLWSLSGGSGGGGEGCQSYAFPAWTRLLTDTVLASGGVAVIATPVQNVALEFDPRDFDRDAAPPAPSSLGARHKSLLACSLQPRCALGKALLRAFREAEGETLAKLASAGGRAGAIERRALAYGAGRPRPLSLAELEVRMKAEAWSAAAGRPGVELVAFHERLIALSPDGVLSERWFADSLRLTPEGYLFLARLLAERVASRAAGTAERPVPPPAPGEWARYLDSTRVSSVGNAVEQFTFARYLTVVPALRLALESFPGDACRKKGFCEQLDWARLAQAWLRREAGLPHGLKPPLAGRLAGFSPLGSRLDPATGAIVAEAGR